MRYICIIAICIVILLVGFSEVIKEKSVSKSLTDIIRFINFYETALNYRKPDYDELCKQCSGMDFRYISFDNGVISLSDDVRKEIQVVFSEFLGQIGTTDADGQVSLCKEYSSRFGDMLSERKNCENNKIKVNIAVSLLSAVGVFVTFI